MNDQTIKPKLVHPRIALFGIALLVLVSVPVRAHASDVFEVLGDLVEVVGDLLNLSAKKKSANSARGAREHLRKEESSVKAMAPQAKVYKNEHAQITVVSTQDQQLESVALAALEMIIRNSDPGERMIEMQYSVEVPPGALKINYPLRVNLGPATKELTFQSITPAELPSVSRVLAKYRHIFSKEGLENELKATKRGLKQELAQARSEDRLELGTEVRQSLSKLKSHLPRWSEASAEQLLATAKSLEESHLVLQKIHQERKCESLLTPVPGETPYR